MYSAAEYFNGWETTLVKTSAAANLTQVTGGMIGHRQHDVLSQCSTANLCILDAHVMNACICLHATALAHTDAICVAYMHLCVVGCACAHVHLTPFVAPAWPLIWLYM